MITPPPKISLGWAVDVGQTDLAHYHGDVFIGRGTAYVRGCWGFGRWGGGCASVAALSLWLSKLCACRGWLAGRPPEKRVGMQVMMGEEAASFSTLQDSSVCCLVHVFSKGKSDIMRRCEIEFFTFEQNVFWKTKWATTD